MKIRSGILLMTLCAITAAISMNIVTEPLRPTETVPSTIPTFVFDLNGVLFDTDVLTVLRQLGMKDVLWYFARFRSVKMLKNRFYQILDQIKKPIAHGTIKDNEGLQMPHLMVNWLRGTRPNKNLLQHILLAIKNNPQWFLNTTEQRLMAAMARSIFDPDYFVASRKLLFDLMPLISQLKKRGAKLYILSNWDKESFELLKKRFPSLFQLFDGYIISGDTGHAKPELAIFTHTMHTIATHKMTSPYICFLDDQQENIDAAKKIGWHAILVTKTKSYLGFSPSLDVDAITKNALQCLEKYAPRQKTSPSQPLPEAIHATY